MPRSRPSITARAGSGRASRSSSSSPRRSPSARAARAAARGRPRRSAPGFGSFLARVLDLDARDARIAVASGMAAGIGAIFRAPLGGAVLGAEIPYREDVESDALVPASSRSVVAFSIFGVLIGFSADLRPDRRRRIHRPAPARLLRADRPGRGLVGPALHRRLLRRHGAGSARWRIPREVKPAIAGFAVGCIGIVVPGALGTGYGWVQAGARPRDAAGAAAVDGAGPALRQDRRHRRSRSARAARAASSGRAWSSAACSARPSGGCSSPSRPAMPADPAPFVIVAMMALFGSVAHAPLAVMLMVAEMTGNLSMLAPAMIAIGIATLVVGDRTIYRSQLQSPHRVAGAPLPLRDAAHVVDPRGRRGASAAPGARAKLHAARRSSGSSLRRRARRAGDQR